MALTVPSMMPSRQISRLPQSGHQRRRGADALVAVGRGASRITSSAIAAIGTLQKAKAPLPRTDQRQDQGQRQGNRRQFADQQSVGVNGGGKAMRCGVQARTAGGMVTCMMATPAPIATVMA